MQNQEVIDLSIAVMLVSSSVIVGATMPVDMPSLVIGGVSTLVMIAFALAVIIVSDVLGR